MQNIVLPQVIWGRDREMFLAFLSIMCGINWPSTFYIYNYDESLWKCHKVNPNLPCCWPHAHKKFIPDSSGPSKQAPGLFFSRAGIVK